MFWRTAALTGVFLTYGSPISAQEYRHLSNSGAANTITTIEIGTRQVNILAVPRKARIDSKVQQIFDEECRNMAKVMPGYPQPAYVTLNFRLNF